jgi:hypothetical protein
MFNLRFIEMRHPARAPRSPEATVPKDLPTILPLSDVALTAA